MRVIQRTPDLGIGIKLQRATSGLTPKAPYWFGWAGADSFVSVLTTVWNQTKNPAYLPGMWCAVVENAVKVDWQIEYLPMLWFKGSESHNQEIVAWTGPEVQVSLPVTQAPDYVPDTVALPDPLAVGNTNIPRDVYWGDTIESLPLIIGTGNVLSVMPYFGSPSGILTARASVAGKSVGVVQLTIKRVTTGFV